MTGGLREALGLPEINSSGRAAGNEGFGKDFRAGLAGVNQDMQVVAAQASQTDHQKLDSQRQNLIAAYQTASTLGDPGANERVIAAVGKAKEIVAAKAAGVMAGRDAWQKREVDFDAALVKIGELEDAGHPKAPAYRKLADAIQNRANDKNYQDANTAFDQLQPKLNDVKDEQLAALLDPKAKEPTPDFDGTDNLPGQAISPKDLIDPAKEIGKAALKWVNKQGETTVIIENHSSKVLSRVDGSEELTHPKEAKWIKKAPPEIAAAKDGKPGKATMTVKTDMLIRGVTRANTSGLVMYEIVGEVKKGKVKIAWLRKGNGTLDDSASWTESGLYDIRGFQSNDGEFTFLFTEKAPVPKPKDPQPPTETKPKEPESTGAKPKPFEYSVGPFVTGKHDKLESGSILDHANEIWNRKLSAETRDAILQQLPEGKLKIEVHGYTSNTDTKERNFKLSEQRALAVISALKEVGIPETAFTKRQPHGEWEAQATDDKQQEKEDPDWRKVVVKVSQ
jgi:hypothetical protein